MLHQVEHFHLSIEKAKSQADSWTPEKRQMMPRQRQPHGLRQDVS